MSTGPARIAVGSLVLLMFKHTQTIQALTQQAQVCVTANPRNKERGGKEVRATQESSLQGFSLDALKSLDRTMVRHSGWVAWTSTKA